MNAWLLDTGPIVAFLDQADAAHQSVVHGLQRFTGRFVTTDAVIVEAMHLVSRSPAGPGLLIDFLFSSQAAIHSSMSAQDLLQAGELMRKYADVPMDFADATLVLLAARAAGAGNERQVRAIERKAVLPRNSRPLTRRACRAGAGAGLPTLAESGPARWYRRAPRRSCRGRASCLYRDAR